MPSHGKYDYRFSLPYSIPSWNPNFPTRHFRESCIGNTHCSRDMTRPGRYNHCCTLPLWKLVVSCVLPYYFEIVLICFFHCFGSEVFDNTQNRSFPMTTMTTKTTKTTGTTVSKALGYALGPVTSGIVDYVDVDGIVQRIDIDALMNRVDIDTLIDKVDMNKLLMKVDMNKILLKVDLNALVKTVDVNELMERAEIGAIVARSTAGVFAPLMDSIRSQMVIVDQFVQGIGICRNSSVPPAPGIHTETPPMMMPKGAANIAVAIQGRYSGTLSRGLAFVIDQSIISATFALVVYFIQKGVELISRKAEGSIQLENLSYGPLLALSLWQFVYFTSALAAKGQTIGKVITGLKVINYEDGSSVTSWRAVVRTLLLPINIWLIFGVVMGIVRKDRREFHDVMAGTGVVYSWDARLAKYRDEMIEESKEICTYNDTEEMTAHSNHPRFGLFRRKKGRKQINSPDLALSNDAVILFENDVVERRPGDEILSI